MKGQNARPILSDIEIGSNNMLHIIFNEAGTVDALPKSYQT